MPNRQRARQMKEKITLNHRYKLGRSKKTSEPFPLFFFCPDQHFNNRPRKHNQIHVKTRTQLTERFQFASKHHRSSVSHNWREKQDRVQNFNTNRNTLTVIKVIQREISSTPDWEWGYRLIEIPLKKSLKLRGKHWGTFDNLNDPCPCFITDSVEKYWLGDLADDHSSQKYQGSFMLASTTIQWVTPIGRFFFSISDPRWTVAEVRSISACLCPFVFFSLGLARRPLSVCSCCSPSCITSSNDSTAKEKMTCEINRKIRELTTITVGF